MRCEKVVLPKLKERVRELIPVELFPFLYYPETASLLLLLLLVPFANRLKLTSSVPSLP